MNLVVIEQVDVVAEEADLHVRAREEDLRVGMEQQQRGPLQVRPLAQVQPVDEGRRRFCQQRGIDTPAPPGLLPKPVHRRPRQVLQARVGHRHAVPVQSLLAQQKPGQCRALQLLPGAAAAVVVLPLAADRVRLRFHDDLQVLLAGFDPPIDVHDDAQDVTHLVRNVLQELAHAGEAHDHAVVVATDDQHAALRVREAADPAQILVAPATLPLHVLALAHARDRLFRYAEPRTASGSVNTTGCPANAARRIRVTNLPVAPNSGSRRPASTQRVIVEHCIRARHSVERFPAQQLPVTRYVMSAETANIPGAHAPRPYLRIDAAGKESIGGRELIWVDFIGPRFDVNDHELPMVNSFDVRAYVAIVYRVATASELLHVVPRLR